METPIQQTKQTFAADDILIFIFQNMGNQFIDGDRLKPGEHYIWPKMAQAPAADGAGTIYDSGNMQRNMMAVNYWYVPLAMALQPPAAALVVGI